ncbi:transcriptional regulator FtrA [Hafnia paralvei]|uniref:transcriptional regulator FtrA n=1 Tax=Hafnia paralvei TaxID=546367 RepID=UPI001FFF4D7C|nr:transcriptional regulator FtrA [Hafnia paralvei]MCK2180577.1 transcriptional regulator FtrA [Hafnia paralvei]
MDRNPSLVATLAYDGLCSFEFGIALEIFALPRPEFDFPWYQHCVVGVDDGPMRTTNGVTMLAEHGLEYLAQAKTIVIPGWRGNDVPPPPALLEAVRAAYKRGVRFITICSGVFVLAAAGILSGKRVTTHWRYCQQLAERYPDVQVDADVLYVDSGQIMTSAGSAAGIDACLYLVSKDFGVQIANRVARRLVMAPQRSGGQKQFIAHSLEVKTHDGLYLLLEKVQTSLHLSWSVKMMARESNMSERTLARRFAKSLGMSPASWLQQARMSLACEQLELGNKHIESVAEMCGFSTSEGFRQAFRQHLGISPSVYRRRFSQNNPLSDV